MELSTITQRLNNHYAQVTGYKDSIGYPSNLNLEYLEPLQRFLLLPLNNVGSAFSTGSRNYPLSTIDYEYEVIRFMATLYGLSDEAGYHGYITSGGTEANLQGLYMARESYPDGILYFSASSHYSIPKSARLLALPYQIIPTDANGEMDYSKLEERLQQQTGDSAIISLNIGSTMQGAIDQVEKVIEVLQRQGILRFHIHCDAALFGFMLPFLPDSPCPSFRQNLHSLAVSGHKFIGCPFPCGIVICRSTPKAAYIEYVQSLDTTITGSRNGHAPLLLWYALMSRGVTGLGQEAHICIENARYLQERLTQMNYPNHRGIHSNIVCLRPPSDTLVKKWDLAVENEWAHVVVMQHVDRERLDRFLEDLTLEI